MIAAGGVPAVSGRPRRPANQALSVRFALLALLLLPLPSEADLFFGDNHSETEWRELQSAHFRVIHAAGSAILAERALSIAENAWQPVTALTGGAPPGRIDIVLRDFSDRSSGLAYSAWPRIEIEPYTLDRDVESIDFLRQVVIHEFTHVAMFHAVGGHRFSWIRTPLAMENLPDWWVEGLASALEKRRADPREEDLLRVTALDGRLPRTRRQDSIDQGDLNDLRLVYRVGESKIRYLAHRFGDDVFARVHREMRPFPWSFDHALKRVTGMGEDELDRAWRAELTACYGGEREGGAGRVEGSIPLGPLERPLAASWSSRGDLAVAAVRDEDRWWTELYLAPGGDPADLALIDAGPVSADFSWSPDGESLVYARMVNTESNADIFDIFRYHRETGEITRLTHGRRARSPVWLSDSSRIAAIGYEPSDGSSHLLLLSPRGGVEDRIPAPPDVRTMFDLAASPGGMRIAFSALTMKDEREIFIFDLSTGLVRAVSPNGGGGYELSWGADGVISLLRYRKGLPEWVEIAPDREGEIVARQKTSRQVTDLVPAPGGGFYQVASAGRYRSDLAPLEPPADERHSPSSPAWNATGLITLPTDAPRGRIARRQYGAWRSMRLRPEFGLNTVSSDRLSLSVDELLADPLDIHVVSVEGDRRYDGRESSGSLSYTNRAFFPTLRITGGYREEDLKDAPWREVARSGAFRLSFPAGFTAVSSRVDLALALEHDDVDRSYLDTTDQSFHRSDLVAAFTYTVSSPRRFRRIAAEWRRGFDTGASSIKGERFATQLAWQRAIFRNDWFLSLSASASAETGGEKVLLAVAPAGLADPSQFETGDAIARYGAEFSWPLSEDLHRAIGPFSFERLTHRVRIREGRAWLAESLQGVVRSASTEVGCRIFSGHFLPFAGTETVTVTGGYARELTGEKRDEWFFALDTSIFSDRWSAALRR